MAILSRREGVEAPAVIRLVKRHIPLEPCTISSVAADEPTATSDIDDDEYVGSAAGGNGLEHGGTSGTEETGAQEAKEATADAKEQSEAAEGNGKSGKPKGPVHSLEPLYPPPGWLVDWKKPAEQPAMAQTDQAEDSETAKQKPAAQSASKTSAKPSGSSKGGKLPPVIVTEQTEEEAEKKVSRGTYLGFLNISFRASKCMGQGFVQPTNAQHFKEILRSSKVGLSCSDMQNTYPALDKYSTVVVSLYYTMPLVVSLYYTLSVL